MYNHVLVSGVHSLCAWFHQGREYTTLKNPLKAFLASQTLDGTWQVSRGSTRLDKKFVQFFVFFPIKCYRKTQTFWSTQYNDSGRNKPRNFHCRVVAGPCAFLKKYIWRHREGIKEVQLQGLKEAEEVRWVRSFNRFLEARNWMETLVWQSAGRDTKERWDCLSYGFSERLRSWTCA